MPGILDPASYDAWYYAGKGKWIGETEFSLIRKLIHPASDKTLLDVGCGTGYFSQRFNDIGLDVTGIDIDENMLDYARLQHKAIKFIQGDAHHLPFDNDSFDYATAITSLCFIHDPQHALSEMWRVSRKGVVLGLLNRNSLLYLLKHKSKSYKGARWDTSTSAYSWLTELHPQPRVKIYSAVWYPFDNHLSHWIESIIPNNLRYGGFLGISLMK